MRISSRDNLTKTAYMGQAPHHVPNPYPTSITNPSADPSGAYNELSDDDACAECDNDLENVFDPETGQYYFRCNKCGSRYSKKSFNHGYSHYGMQPGTLDSAGGSNVNNEPDHPNYHGPIVRDDFSGNLGKN
jgi:hypothetical protein